MKGNAGVGDLGVGVTGLGDTVVAELRHKEIVGLAIERKSGAAHSE